MSRRSKPEWSPAYDDVHKVTHQICEKHNKVLYNSKQEARRALMGNLRSKSIRIYKCDAHPGRWHLTRWWRQDYEKGQS